MADPRINGQGNSVQLFGHMKFIFTWLRALNRERGEELESLLSLVTNAHLCTCIITSLFQWKQILLEQWILIQIKRGFDIFIITFELQAILIFHCCSKLPEIYQLKTTHIYYFKVLQVSNIVNVLPGLTSYLEVLGENPFAGSFWLLAEFSSMQRKD